MMSQSDNPLADSPFSFTETKTGSVLISHRGRVVKTLQGKSAQQFLARISGSSDADCQLRMAKITGQFKFGNERAGKQADQSRFGKIN
jgi:hypothetical protein